MLEKHRTHHAAWNVKHFPRAHRGAARFLWGYTWTKTQLQRRGWWSGRFDATVSPMDLWTAADAPDRRAMEETEADI